MEVYFKDFRSLCLSVSRETSYNAKTELIHNFIYDEYKKNTSSTDVYIIVKLLLPGVSKLIYNVNDKQIIKFFSKILKFEVEEINKYVVDTGDVAYVIGSFLKKSTSVYYATQSTLKLQDIDCFLTRLSKVTKEHDQIKEFKKIIPKCTPNDLRYIIRLVKHDLRMNIGPKHVLAALHEKAYDIFKLSNDLEYVVNKSLEGNLKPVVKPMIPIHPMLASICKTFSEAKEKCKGGIIVEFKYDGERIQVHKDGDNFKFFSRSLKPVTPHKISSFEELLVQAFPSANNMILDGEIILVDKETNKPLPFGTLGINKKAMYNNACICFFIFDCLYFNDISLIDKPLSYRRDIISSNIIEISNRVLLSEVRLIEEDKELIRLLKIVLSKGIEGFVLKDEKGVYEPGMRRWLKIKKDYLDNGSMADKADLLVLGAYYGKGNKSGLLSSFLMGCYDEESKKWCTVTKCSGGHSDSELKEIQKSISIEPFDKNNIPDWLCINKAHYPDVIITNVETAPVWEIAGAEFTTSPSHTAANISIRFPRCVRVREDKDFKTASTLSDIKALYSLSVNNN
ncbi:CNPV061 DNA ligase [Canarypox virus]|uniref:DNA ligase n=1 Tax=Canarypox virus TaxID=44088 RepID=Q6VZT6_CNPV|nr:CNPV061 DNA ligase [Canarypox virus]AAR83407.1 CNPV061 DNA ligase [Canarypox virus]AWD84537.1 DNA ligase [Canarypox virus]